MLFNVGIYLFCNFNRGLIMRIELTIDDLYQIIEKHTGMEIERRFSLPCFEYQEHVYSKRTKKGKYVTKHGQACDDFTISFDIADAEDSESKND